MDQLWISSWDAPGSYSILQRSDQSQVRLFAGAIGFTQISRSPLKSPAAQVDSTRFESPESSVTPTISSVYRVFQDIFSKQAASQLPPHRPLDCAIDLLPGYKLPKGRVYPLSIPVHKAMEEYIKEALNQGYIRPSSSPAASSFFFVGKKDGGLRPCIDYQALNTQTVKLPYRLPLIPATLEEPHAARIFSKLDLCSAYNLVRIWEGDEWKTPFITPSSHNEYLVMPCGLSNAPSVLQELMNKVFREFLHRSVIVYIDDILIYLYIWNLADHGLPTMPSKALGPHSARPPSFVIQIPMRHSWWKWTPPLWESGPCCPSSMVSLQPCAYYSRKLTPAEQNYDNGNRELSAIKLALEEWQHWMEGANTPSMVITDHQNLQYL